MAAAVLVVSAANGAPPRPVAAASRGPAVPATTSATPHREVYVRAPVRIADAAAARLLHPGDRVDVLAGGRVVAVSARVIGVLADQDESSGLVVAREGIGTGVGGALVVLSVPRKTAAALSGAAATSPLAVALC